MAIFKLLQKTLIMERKQMLARALLATMLLATTAQAQAESVQIKYAEIGYKAPAAKVKTYAKPKQVAKRRAPAVAAWVMRGPTKPPQFMDAGVCAYPIAISGSASLNDELAEASAQKALREQIEMDLGQAYMDLANAKHYAKICTSASAGGLVGEFQRRCKVVAVPCRPPLQTRD